MLSWTLGSLLFLNGGSSPTCTVYAASCGPRYCCEERKRERERPENRDLQYRNMPAAKYSTFTKLMTNSTPPYSSILLLDTVRRSYWQLAVIFFYHSKMPYLIFAKYYLLCLGYGLNWRLIRAPVRWWLIITCNSSFLQVWCWLVSEQ